jgi:hypothetical protein
MAKTQKRPKWYKNLSCVISSCVRQGLCTKILRVPLYKQSGAHPAAALEGKSTRRPYPRYQHNEWSTGCFTCACNPMVFGNLPNWSTLLRLMLDGECPLLLLLEQIQTKVQSMSSPKSLPLPWSKYDHIHDDGLEISCSILDGRIFVLTPTSPYESSYIEATFCWHYLEEQSTRAGVIAGDNTKLQIQICKSKIRNGYKHRNLFRIYMKWVVLQCHVYIWLYLPEQN